MIFVLGAVVSALAGDLAFLLAGRLVIGVGVGVGAGIGAASMLTPLHLAEIAPAKMRGALVSLNQLAITLGILCAYLVGHALAADGSWRRMLGLVGVPGVVLATGMVLLPETPRWLTGHGHMDRARQAPLLLRGEGTAVREELALLRDDLTSPPKSRPQSRIGHAGNRLPLIVGVGLMVSQQVTCINTVIYFAPTIFQAASLSSASAAILAAAGVGVVNVLTTVVAIWLVDWVGRRELLIWGLGGMGVSLCLLALGFVLGQGQFLTLLTGASLTVYVGLFGDLYTCLTQPGGGARVSPSAERSHVQALRQLVRSHGRLP